MTWSSTTRAATATPRGWKHVGIVLPMESSLGEALGLSGFVAKEAGVLPGCREGVQLFPGVLRAAGKHLCRLQCSTVPFFYPAIGCTRLKNAAGGHRAGERRDGTGIGLSCHQ